MKESFTRIMDYISGERAFSNVSKISNFNRIQASTGYRKAAMLCREILCEEGFDTTLKTFKMDGEKWYLTGKSFKEWHCERAYCELVSPINKKLADFGENNMSIIQKSYPCDYRNEEIEVVYLNKGSCKSKYEDEDFRGKVIFVRDSFKQYMDWAVKEKGAIGIMTDNVNEMKNVRSKYDLLDVLTYTSFWWKHSEGEPEIFGFVLSPREGEDLAKLCEKMIQENLEDPSKDKYPKINCFVDSKIYDGEIEVIETILPGETDEEVLIVAHLCHPKLSANDNASGVAASIEALKTIKDLIDLKRLEPLKRAIRVIFVPEFTGTYAYLDSLGDNITKIKAGINLDMVGGRQDKTHGPLTITGLPKTTQSFVEDLAALILDEASKDVLSHNKDSYVAMFSSAISEFQAGSDHIMLSDPTINIPTIMLGQWPDKYYHTSADSLEQIDPFILKKSSSIAAGYVYSLANFNYDYIPTIMNKTRERFSYNLTKVMNEFYQEQIDIDKAYEKIESLKTAYFDRCDSYMSFFDKNENQELANRINREKNFLDKLSKDFFARLLDETSSSSFTPKKIELREEFKYIPVRKFISPIVHLEDYALEDEELMKAFDNYDKNQRKKVFSPHLTETLIQYYINGRDDVNEIARKIILDTNDGDSELVNEYIQLLIKYGIVEIK